MLYQSGFLRHIKAGANEVLRMIYFALRNEDWSTCEFSIENEKAETHPTHFTIAYDRYDILGKERIFHWVVKINGTEQGEIHFTIDGFALADIRKNRAGFCVLHPIAGVVGRPCEIQHPDGKQSNLTFPIKVSPQNPFKQVQSMRWETFDSEFHLEFVGDVFETEDQRNWTDASFKTFCTPLDRPFPVQLKAGDRVSQTIRFRPISLNQPPTEERNAIQVSITRNKCRLPEIGIGASSETVQINEKAEKLLRDLSLSHYRVDVDFQNESWRKTLATEAEKATRLGLSLEVVLQLSLGNVSDQVDSFEKTCTASGIAPGKVLVLGLDHPTTPQEIIQDSIRIKTAFPFSLLGAGTDYNFAELNRSRFSIQGLDFVSFAIQPQEHAFDDLTLIESLEAQRDVVTSAKSIYGDAIRVHVSPLTLRKRHNPYARDPANRKIPLALRADPRQKTPFASLFLLGSIKSLSTAGVSSVTVFETIGNQGILSHALEPFPVYECLRELLDDTYDIIMTETDHPLLADSLLLSSPRRKKLILWNYTDKEQSVWMEGTKYTIRPFEIRIELKS
jgi:hypothetical protein